MILLILRIQVGIGFLIPLHHSAPVGIGRFAVGHLLLAVLEKRLGLRFSGCDVYLNVVGGLRLDEPAADAAIAAAMISSIRDIPLPQGIILAGEIGLAGEVRAIASVEQRVSEARRLGFDTIAIPKQSAKREKIKGEGISVAGLDSVFDMLKLFKKEEK